MKRIALVLGTVAVMLSSSIAAAPTQFPAGGATMKITALYGRNQGETLPAGASQGFYFGTDTNVTFTCQSGGSSTTYVWGIPKQDPASTATPPPDNPAYRD